MSKLLINEPPLQVLPSLAEAIGLNEAIVLQQVHYLMNYAQFTFENKRWLYNTYEQWQSAVFRFWSTRTLQRIFSSLEDLGVIESTTKFNRNIMNKTKWYTINYENVERLSQVLMEERNGQYQAWAMVKPTIEPDVAEEWLSEQETPSALNDNVQTVTTSEETNNYRRRIRAQLKSAQETAAKVATADIVKNAQSSSFISSDFDEPFQLFWKAGLVKINEKKVKEAFIEHFYADWLHCSKDEHPFIADFPRTPQGYAEFLVKDIRYRLDVNQIGFKNLYPLTYICNCRWKDEFTKGHSLGSTANNKSRSQVIDSVSKSITFGGDWNNNEGWRRQMFFQNTKESTEQFPLISKE